MLGTFINYVASAERSKSNKLNRMNRPKKEDYLTTNQFEYDEKLNQYYSDLEKYVNWVEAKGVIDGFRDCKDCGQKKLAGIQCKNSEGVCEIDKIYRTYGINPPKK